MQIIIEVKNAGVLNRILDLLRLTKWFGAIRVWKQKNEKARRELVYDFKPTLPPSSGESAIDYREYWACIQPQMGIETVDRLIAEMRED
ncbi:MAG: hypothetical protein ACE5FF_00050 [Saprospiraceae bacterium]